MEKASVTGRAWLKTRPDSLTGWRVGAADHRLQWIFQQVRRRFRCRACSCCNSVSSLPACAVVDETCIPELDDCRRCRRLSERLFVAKYCCYCPGIQCNRPYPLGLKSGLPFPSHGIAGGQRDAHSLQLILWTDDLLARCAGSPASDMVRRLTAAESLGAWRNTPGIALV